ncbi:MAG TPA: hypothetical protein VLM85_09825 [Polyangiaceae bacterium]|nr:hypothetical protein [Polyangiaceae bacterium]
MRRGLLLFVLASCGGNQTPAPAVDAGLDANASAYDGTSVDAVEELSPDEIAGVVVDEAALPLEGATVRIGTSTVTTDANGQFVVHGVGASYDAFVVNNVYGVPVFASYVGLTTRTPELQSYAQSGWSTTVTGSISPAPSTFERIALAFDVTPSGLCELSSGGYSVSPSGTWTVNSADCYGYQTLHGATYALTYAAVPGLPTTLYGFGQSSLTMNVSATNSAGTIPVASSPPQGSMSISASGSPSLMEFGLGVVFNVGNHGHLGFSGLTSQATVATLATSGTTVGVSASARTAIPDGGTYTSSYQAWSFRGALNPSDTVSLALLDPFFTTSPADGATGIGAAATLSWQSVPNAVYRVSIGCDAGNTSVYSGEVYTSATQAVLPNAPDFGVVIPSGASCTWSVGAMGPASSVDDVAGGAWSPQNVINWSERSMTGFDDATPTVTFTAQ